MMTWLLAEHAISIEPLSHPFFFILRTSYSTPQHTTAPVTNSPDTVDLKSEKATNVVGQVSGFVLKFKEVIDVAVSTNPRLLCPGQALALNCR
jgi:uncharacterized lipoprotein YddW (UPF0748 family)